MPGTEDEHKPFPYSIVYMTMYICREAYMLEFFAYQTCGGSIGHAGGIARADFA